jgi:ABC-type transport system substrate-binding protein
LEAFFFMIYRYSMSIHRSRVAFLLIPAIAFSALFSAGGGSARQVERIKPGGTLRVRTFTLNPFKPELDPVQGAHVFILNQIYDGLVRLDKNLAPVGSLADYWMISDGGRTYTFFLRKGVKFHHGRELDADDVKFSLERVIHSENKGSYYQFLTTKVVGAQEYREGRAPGVAGFTVLDKYTFEIDWKSPYVSALSLLSMDFCKILPRELVQSQGSGFFQKPSGTGPFKFDYWLRNSKLEVSGVRLERNDDYFSRKPYLEAIEFSPYYTPQEFLDRQVDIIPYSSDFLAGKQIQVLEAETFTTAFLMMSCHLAPLDKPAVRRAIAMSIDKKEIAKAAFRMDTNPHVTDNFIPARLPGFFPIAGKPGFNPEEARKILVQEGLAGERAFPRLTLFVQEARRVGEPRIYGVLKEELGRLGISLRLREYQSYDEIKSSKDPYLVFLDWGQDFPDPENIVLPLFYSSAALNQTVLRYSNPRLDDLADAAEVEQSRTGRIALFHKIEDLLFLDMPAIPLYSRQHRLALQSYVRGVQPPPLGFFYLDAKDIWLDQ